MALFSFPNVSLSRILEVARQSTSTLSNSIRLFKSDTTIGVATVLGDLTEADFTGYAALGAQWTGQGIDGDGKARTIRDSFCVFTKTGGADQTVYGWYIYNGSTLILAQRFLAAFTFQAGSLTLSFLPSITLARET